MTEIDELTSLLEQKQKLVAMVAPSYPIMYEKSELIQTLKTLGFDYVVEVSVGAKKTNEAIINQLQKDPTARIITSPCASFVRFIRTKYPQFIQYLTLSVDSPMIATARIVQKTYPGYRPIFIGPCIAKKREAQEDYPELKILVVTFKELNQLLSKRNWTPLQKKQDKTPFDIEEKNTRIYPFDGGLTISSGVRSILKEDEIRIVSGYKNCEQVLQEFESNMRIRLVDVLFCEGGCINGPGIQSDLSLTCRKELVNDSLVK